MRLCGWYEISYQPHGLLFNDKNGWNNAKIFTTYTYYWI